MKIYNTSNKKLVHENTLMKSNIRTDKHLYFILEYETEVPLTALKTKENNQNLGMEESENFHQKHIKLGTKVRVL